ncbi:hypothetical protein EYR36_009246 [Pleurotus pulmonarius]|nr:hypothetical protein EYR36_009246 [Pleurotus pulmonarius]KAF4592746.1 hypothetical protein EYR38_008446 [Pleurotus pulmonarius]
MTDPAQGSQFDSFPVGGWIEDSVKVHDGFRKTFERTADGVLSGVQKGLAANNVNKVIVTGHSLDMPTACSTPRWQ